MASDSGRSAPKILEIGATPYMWHAFPDTTEFYSTWPDETHADPGQGRHIASLATLPDLARRIADPAFDLVVAHTPASAPWSGRALGRTLFRRSTLRGNLAVVRGLGIELLRRRAAAPLAVLDFEDSIGIERSNLFLLDQAVAYFKRELPIDHWQVLARTAHRRVPTPRFRSIARHRERIAKLHPISLGLPLGAADGLVASPPSEEKTIDIFFAGRIDDSSTVRQRGFDELMTLREAGYTIDVADTTLTFETYLARCARAHLVWSPEGFGWQTFRICEAAICGAAPLVNRPSIERYRPLIDGIHAVYYDVEPGELARTARAALGDRDRLREIGRAAREHVKAFHTPAAIARHVVETALSAAGCRTPKAERNR
jgi:glycosyltransferase involved in cell wall biosynthesis